MAQLSSALHHTRAIMRRRFALLWWVTAWPYLLLALCFLTAGLILHRNLNQRYDPVTLWQSMGVPAKISVLLAYLASISLPAGFATAGAVIVVWADALGEVLDSHAVFVRIAGMFLRLTFLSLCVGLVCMIGGAFFLVPGLLGFSLLSFSIPVLVVERTSVWTALRNGSKLASRRLGAVLALYASVLVVALVVVMGIVAAGPAADMPWWIHALAVWAVLLALVPVAIMGTSATVVYLYRDLRQPRGEFSANQPA